MLHRSRLRPRLCLVAGALVLALLAVGCGDDDETSSRASLDVDGWLGTSSTTSTTEATTTTTTTTTTTAPPRQLTEADLARVLLRADDVPPQASEVDQTLPTPWAVTDPPACGEALAGDGPGEVRAAQGFFEPEGFLTYRSIAQYTPGDTQDLQPFRAGIAGPCAEGFRYVEDGVESFQRFEPLSDPRVGDDSLAARFEMQYEIDGRQVEVWAYMVYFVRDGVSVQVQIVTGAIPEEGLVGPDIGIDEVIHLARLLDDRVRAL